jgi:hypothetical protein
MRRTCRYALAGLALAAAPVPAGAQSAPLSCNDRDRDDDDGPRVCEIREITLDSRDQVLVDAAPNGSIRIRAWDGNGIRLRTRVEARARSEDRAEELVDQVEIETDGTIRARGARTGRREWWTASFEVFVPREMDLDLHSQNGGIQVQGVSGRIQFETMNGGVTLEGVGGDVRGHTTNGGLDITLAGTSWEGEGLDVRTTNGGVDLTIPEGYNARLETSSVNGGMQADFPVTVRGRIGRSMNLELGSGGPTLRARTTNGGVNLKRP